jgi:acetolactate synthase I/II/III large subunit
VWGAVKRATLGMYPDGEAAKSNNPPLIDLDNLPAFETICEASGGHGERIEDPRALPGAMKRGLKAVDRGQQALLNVISRGGAGAG